MNADTTTIKTLRAFKDLGIQLYVDDFGTGYSCLSYLGQLPIDVLKVDHSFIRRISRDPASVAISRTVASLATALNLGLVAEDVETAEQVAFLRQHGCELVQGFCFSKPVPADELQALLRQRRQRS